MDSERILKLVLQYLAETYPGALSALENESNVTYVDDEMPLGSELVTRLTDYHDISLAAKLGEDVDNRELDQDIVRLHIYLHLPHLHLLFFTFHTSLFNIAHSWTLSDGCRGW